MEGKLLVLNNYKHTFPTSRVSTLNLSLFPLSNSRRLLSSLSKIGSVLPLSPNSSNCTLADVPAFGLSPVLNVT